RAWGPVPPRALPALHAARPRTLSPGTLPVHGGPHAPGGGGRRGKPRPRGVTGGLRPPPEPRPHAGPAGPTPDRLNGARAAPYTAGPPGPSGPIRRAWGPATTLRAERTL